MGTITNRPVPFQGSDEEAKANRETHYWVMVEEGEPPRCGDCDIKSWYAAAKYPCGVNPPRETVEIDNDGTVTVTADEYGADVLA